MADFNRAVESAVVHYGDSATTFLDTWYRKDAGGLGMTYISAVAVEEKRLIDYNRGDPDGVREAGEMPTRPKTPLVAVYPEEGTLFSDNPLYVLDAPWVSPGQRAGAEAFVDFVMGPEAQRQVVRSGFRPGSAEVAVGASLDHTNGVDPAQPQTTLAVPDSPVLVRLIESWNEHRKGARVLLVVDVSGSMAAPASKDDSKLDLAKRAAIDALSMFQPHDLVGLRIFSTGVGPPEHPSYADLVPIGPVSANRERLEASIRSVVPVEGTPLYTVARASYEDLERSFDPERINAVVLLTDGRNEDPEGKDDLAGVVGALQTGHEGLSTTPVRLFTIAYGEDADMGTLRRLAQSTDAASYDASDPRTIDEVFTAVVSNF